MARAKRVSQIGSTHMFYKRKIVAIVFPLTMAAPVAVADDYDWLSSGSWYASVRAGFLPAISSEGEFSGPTQSVYGGSPVIEMDDGSQYTFAIGRDLFDGFRVEFELSFLTSQTDSSTVPGTELRLDDAFRLQADIDSTMFMVNTGYDFDDLNWWAKPYVRAGIGVAETEVDGSLSVKYNSAIWQGTTFEGQTITDQPFAEGSSTELAWNIAAGFKKKLVDRLAVRLEYSFLNRGEAWTGTNESDDAVRFSDLESQQIMLGLDWQFK